MTLGGYVGKTLRVDLSTEEVKEIQFDEKDLQLFIGGSGLAAKIIYDEVPRKIEPFDPENRLVFMTGPLTGTISPSSGRYCVCTRSPLTGIWAEAHSAGFWGPELKFAGYDGIILQGKSDSPVYLWIHDGEVEIKKAQHLWGKDTYTTENDIKRELNDPNVKVACIGPAGEKLVRFASIINDAGRAAGRCGVGAVMGSKLLKAIAVRGTKVSIIKAARDEMLREFLRRIYITVRSHPTVQIYASYGTAGIMTMMHEYGDVPVKNFSRGAWPEGIEKICGETMSKTILKKQTSCYRCLIACGRYIRVDSGPYCNVEGSGPEYETCAAFGALLLNDNLESIAKANDLCNRYGLDTISTGNSIGFAMECYEKGLISKKDTGDVNLTWGNHEAIIKMIHKIALREDFGSVLAEGVKRASEKIGDGAEKFAIHVKGLEIPMHDPRAFKGMGLQYATSHRGGCHLRGLVYQIEQGERIPDLGIHKRYERFSTEEKASIVIAMQNWYDVLDSLIMCKFAVLPPASVNAILSMVTGWAIKLPELLDTGERTYNLKRVFNLRCGITHRDDTLPQRFLREPLPDGGCKGEVVELNKMLPEYYQLRGWTNEGVPTREKLDSLKLSNIVKEF
jgi:aldehyde:ferredoxin oxidoreductase